MFVSLGSAVEQVLSKSEILVMKVFTSLTLLFTNVTELVKQTFGRIPHRKDPVSARAEILLHPPAACDGPGDL